MDWRCIVLCADFIFLKRQLCLYRTWESACVCTGSVLLCAPNGCLWEGDLSGGLGIGLQLQIFPCAAVEDKFLM